MCGIAGYLAGSKGEPDRDVIRRMCDALRHRGPDASGFYFGNGAVLGHRRLSIIDVAGGDQPLGNENGSIQVVFNGEIYNYRDLRTELVKRSHQFKTNSDTEVLVHLYEEVGERTPEYLNGMFAFAIWDANRRTLFLARDRAGKKPLYYTSGPPGALFAFASELKAFFGLPAFSREVNPQAVADFLTLSYIPDPLSIFRGVSKLKPAHTLTVSPSGVHLRRYWASTLSPDEPVKFGDAVEMVDTLAGQAVSRRLMSDVPLGAFLSGGIDSSSVVGYMAQRCERVNTFSIGFSDKRFDELQYARLVARMHETTHKEHVVTPSVGAILETLVNHFDEPFGDSSAIPMLYLSRMTREYVTVALSGDGADEVFGGYRRYRQCLADHKLRRLMPEWLQNSAGAAGSRLGLEPPRVLKSLVRRLSETLADAYFRWMSPFWDTNVENVLSESLRSQLGGYLPQTAFCDRFRPLRDLPPLLQMQAVDFETYLPGDILVKVDRATMAFSLEARCPWLDYTLIEAANRFPAAFKIRGGTGKRVFKQACADLLPHGVLRRRKMGFAVPLATWMRTSLRPLFEAAVFDARMEAYISYVEVKRLWNEHQSGTRNHSSKLWNVLQLALWDRKYIQQLDVCCDDTDKLVQNVRA